MIPTDLYWAVRTALTCKALGLFYFLKLSFALSDFYWCVWTSFFGMKILKYFRLKSNYQDNRLWCRWGCRSNSNLPFWWCHGLVMLWVICTEEKRTFGTHSDLSFEITDPKRQLKRWSEIWFTLLEKLHQLSIKNSPKKNSSWDKYQSQGLILENLINQSCLFRLHHSAAQCLGSNERKN